MTKRPSNEDLKHFGVKGMRWGVHKGLVEPLPASADATRVKEFQGKAKMGGTKALSNDELQTVITRMNLEQQYNRLSPTKGKAVSKFVTDLLLNVGKQHAARIISELLSKQVGKAFKK